MEKIKEFFRRLFHKNVDLALPNESKIQDSRKKDIREELKVKDNTNLLKLQNDYEKGKINEISMSKKQLKEMIELYEKQIQELKYKLAIKKI